MQIQSFSPISNAEARILILGTMPGIQSLELNQYYGNNRNAFWNLLFIIFNEPFTIDYDKKIKFLLNHKVALWDVLQGCFREGSLDSAIKEEHANDINAFLKSHPNIDCIFFNGQKAAKYFKKHLNVSSEYKLITLPSTSPANARISFEKKLNSWQVIKQCAQLQK